MYASEAALYSTRQPCCNSKVHSHRSSPRRAHTRHQEFKCQNTKLDEVKKSTDPFGCVYQPWSYCTYSWALCAVVEYLFKTWSSIRADPLNRLKHPGLHSTEPNTCSAVFWSQWPTAYSNFWYHTMGPGMAERQMRGEMKQRRLKNNRHLEKSTCSTLFLS